MSGSAKTEPSTPPATPAIGVFSRLVGGGCALVAAIVAALLLISVMHHFTDSNMAQRTTAIGVFAVVMMTLFVWFRGAPSVEVVLRRFAVAMVVELVAFGIRGILRGVAEIDGLFLDF